MMHKGYKYYLSRVTVLAAIFSIGSAYSNVPNTDTNPTTFLGPIASLSYTGSMSPTLAYNLLGEGGAHHLRASGTVGFALYDYNRLKITAEYLAQDITYAFFSGTSRQWVNQAAIGADYQQDLNMRFSPQFDLSGYYSHAPSKSLSTVSGTFTNSSGQLYNFVDNRRIAGSNAGGGAVGLSIHPWQGAKTGITLNYDDVHYDQDYSVINEDAVGFGGTAFYNQDLTDHITLGLTGAVRQPFNNYQVNLAWNDLYYRGRWTIGAFGEYTDGKNTLPNTWNAGVNINYAADCITPVLDVKREASYKNEVPVQAPSNNYLMNWVSDPAVHMPQVLAIVDESVTSDPVCAAAVLISAFISPLELGVIGGNISVPQAVSIETASHFSGTNLTFALVSSPTGLTINATTGLITGSMLITSLLSAPIVVRASNACGAAQGSFTVTAPDDK